MNTQKIDLSTDRTNCTTGGREEATLWKVGSADMWFGGEMDCRCCGGEGAPVMEKGEREKSAQGNTPEYFPKAIAWGNERG